MRGDPWVPFHKEEGTRGSPFIKKRSGLHRTPSAFTNDVRTRLKKLLLLLLGGLLLGCRLLCGLLLRCHHSLPPSLSDTDPRFHGLAGLIPL
jgi:hypothetical protein